MSTCQTREVATINEVSSSCRRFYGSMPSVSGYQGIGKGRRPVIDRNHTQRSRDRSVSLNFKQIQCKWQTLRGARAWVLCFAQRNPYKQIQILELTTPTVTKVTARPCWDSCVGRRASALAPPCLLFLKALLVKGEGGSVLSRKSGPDAAALR